MNHQINVKSAPGRYFIDMNECISCGACEGEAGEIYTLDDVSSNYYVYRQPVTMYEELDALSGISICPVACIYGSGTLQGPSPCTPQNANKSSQCSCQVSDSADNCVQTTGNNTVK